MRISDWSSDVCSSDLDASRAVLRGEHTIMLRKELPRRKQRERSRAAGSTATPAIELSPAELPLFDALRELRTRLAREQSVPPYVIFHDTTLRGITRQRPRSEEHTSELQSLMSISYAVFCLKKQT